MPQSSMPLDRSVRKARTLAKKGRHGEALSLISAELKRFPGERRLMAEFEAIGRNVPSDRLPAEAQVERLKALYTDGLHDEVIAGATRLAPHFARFPVLPKLLGGACQATEQFDRAAGAFRLAALMTPGDASVERNLGAVLAKLSRHREAVAAFDEAIRLDPRDYKTIGSRAISLVALSEREAAMAGFEAAIALAPDDLALRHDRALAEMAFGDPAAASESLAAILKRRPAHAESHFTLSRMRRYAAGDPHIAEMQALLKTPALSNADLAHLHFALGKAQDEAGETDEAFAHFIAANRAKRETLPYDIEAQAVSFASVRQGFENGLASKLAGTTPSAAMARRPIFILGMPRSGTTLCEQILASHSTVHGAGELTALRDAIHRHFKPLTTGSEAEAREAADKIRQSYGRVLEEIGGDKPVVTDKMPANFIFAGYIPLIFPEAKIVHLNRDKMATCWSNFRQFFAEDSNGYVYDLEDLARYHCLHDEQMAFWSRAMPGAIYELGYETLTENQEAETRALLDWCGLDFEPACLDFHRTKRRVETASRAQVQRAMYRGSSQEWRRFEAHLAPLAEKLGSPMPATQ
ncbi:tetratricopeptide repeat-containing sulfotransferase family protein [Jiella mangrovi]|uniref:Sulfotransferase n=1 Tax=Jiella mangrovi TaxID=2821407 RepID=A0ABS4BBT0_9HYPH|nr:sulfotransferase family protein [Jiella mangrovi]MBP0614189.1 sulfotransferase [Jiella mangrovi]